LEELRLGWGTEEYVRRTLEWVAPSAAADESLRRWFGSFLRMAASPAAAVAIETICRDFDLRPILPTITVPTLVVHRLEDAVESIDGARYIAERIPQAKLIEMSALVPGSSWGPTNRTLDGNRAGGGSNAALVSTSTSSARAS
jgi:pimeloyl-ACP methyl ester carboxylesterase